MRKHVFRSGLMGGALLMATTFFSFSAHAQTQAAAVITMSAEARAKSDESLETKAAEWASSLHLNDAVKETRLKTLMATHLKTIRDWHNEHPFSTVPAGINPLNGKRLSELDRQIIANSAMPQSVHQDLMTGLRKDLSEEQVEAVLDKYTVGKVAFTMNGYKAIVPNMTPEEEAFVLSNLKLAREQAIDFKNMNQISAIFEIYKTNCEQYFNTHGRNWREMYKAYTDAVKAKKAADKAAAKKAQ